MPPVSRNAAQSLALLAVRAQVWKHDVAVDELVVCVCGGGRWLSARMRAACCIPHVRA